MKERPILFSTSMVQAILEGRKTQTRRIVKPQPTREYWFDCLSKICTEYSEETIFTPDTFSYPGLRPVLGARVGRKTGFAAPYINCPYGAPGDRLWVRETWLPAAWDAKTKRIKVLYKADMRKSNWITPFPDDHTGKKFNHLWLSICDELDKKGIQPDDEGAYHFSGTQIPLKWRPSIHMPRAACRLLLENTDLRAERLQEISEADAVAEGCTGGGTWETAPTIQYSKLWESINGPESWSENPWVWVISFKPI